MSGDSPKKYDSISYASLERTNIPLLKKTQAYLKSLLEPGAPDSELTQAWEEFYLMYSRIIQRFILARGIRSVDVDDCVQKVWNTVATKLIDFEHPGNRRSLRSWLYTVVRSKATNLVRHKMRRPAASLGQAMEAGEEPVDDEADPAALFKRQWESAMVHTLLEELKNEVSEINYRVLQMRMIDGCDVKEVALALDLTLEQVWYRQHRMLKKLRLRQAAFSGEAADADE